MIQWLLRKNPALWGDLLEERASGRPRAWFWRQVVAAVARSIGRDVLSDPLRFVRAVLLSMVVLSIGLLLASGIVGLIAGCFAIFGLNLALSSPQLIQVPIAAIPFFAVGWVIARAYRPCMEAAILVIISVGMFHARWIVIVEDVAMLAGAVLEVRRHERSTQKGTGGDGVHRP